MVNSFYDQITSLYPISDGHCWQNYPIKSNGSHRRERQIGFFLPIN